MFIGHLMIQNIFLKVYHPNFEPNGLSALAQAYKHVVKHENRIIFVHILPRDK